LTIAFVTRVATVDQNIVPCSSQLWAIQHTWSTGTAELLCFYSASRWFPHRCIVAV